MVDLQLFGSAVLSVICTVFAFSSLITDPGEFLNWDDTENFVTNTHIKSLSTENAKWALSHVGVLGVYEPASLILKMGAFSILGSV